MKELNGDTYVTDFEMAFLGDHSNVTLENLEMFAFAYVRDYDMYQETLAYRQRQTDIAANRRYHGIAFCEPTGFEQYCNLTEGDIYCMFTAVEYDMRGLTLISDICEVEIEIGGKILDLLQVYVNTEETEFALPPADDAKMTWIERTESPSTMVIPPNGGVAILPGNIEGIGIYTYIIFQM
jgi:hypothetical protein